MPLRIGPAYRSTLFLVVALLIAPAASAGVDAVTISGNVATVDLSLLLVDAELTLTFESVSGLSESSLGLALATASSTDTTLLARLPSSVSLATALPMLITVAPPANGGLEFEGRVWVELYTDDLHYSPGTALRLFSAPDSTAAFVDVTESVSSGSYRVRGAKGDFSEFLVLVDSRSVDTVIDAKLDRLDGLLTAYETQIDSLVFATLEGYFEDVEDFYLDDELPDALDKLEDFLEEVEDNSGSDVPDEWDAAGTMTNVAGELRAAGETLRFSLEWKDAL